MTDSAARARDCLNFGPFQLITGERTLVRAGTPVEIGGRTLDLLIALASRPNVVVSKKDLLAQVWPDVIVEEGSLRFQVAALRRALGDGVNGARFIATVAGRGYCFVAPVTNSFDREDEKRDLVATFPHAHLPGRLVRMVGRDDDLMSLSNQIMAERFVTIVGAGGVGKTTVATAVAHDLIRQFAGAVLFIDLGMLSDAGLVPTAVASMLGLSVQTDDATPGLLAYLANKHVLLILDTCEHLIEAVADLASQLLLAAPRLHILATSREALRVAGEQIYKLDVLACPPEYTALTAVVARAYPATQLFMERAIASGARPEFDDADCAIVANICRKLDGMALAIELAAGRVSAHGLQQTAALLDQRLTLLWPGQRTAPPRQKTLQATLDWGYGLLSPPERIVLRQLAVFVGHFTIEAALAVVKVVELDEALVFATIDSLVAKSMVASRPIGAMMRYRLLDTTRTYLLQLDNTEVDIAGLFERHATYYCRWLEQTGDEWSSLSTGAQRAPHVAALNNVRAALEWCFGADGKLDVGVGLASAAVPVLLSMSLLSECLRWTERALLALDNSTRGGREEMHLQTGLGMSLMFTRGHSEVARTALQRSLAIAEDRGDVRNQMLLLGPLHMFSFRTGDFRASLNYGRRSSSVAQTLDDVSAIALGHCLAGMSLHMIGDFSSARAELEATLQGGPQSRTRRTVDLGFDYYSWAGIALARTLWMQGHPGEAMVRLNQTVRDAQLLDHTVTLTIILHWAAALFLWNGDLQNAEKHLDWFIERAATHSMEPYLAVGVGLKGELAIRRGDTREGIEGLENCLDRLHASHYELITTSLNMALAQSYATVGRISDGIRLIDETIELIETHGNFAFLSESLRVKGVLLQSLSPTCAGDADQCLRKSLQLSQAQGAQGWALRAATDLAALLATQGKNEDAAVALRPVFDTFAKDIETADLIAAKRVLAALG